MAFLLDTNVLSEVVRKTPEQRIVSWLESLDPVDAFISVLTLGEISKGVALMAPGERKERLTDWVAADLPGRFRGRLLPVDGEVARVWGVLSAEGKRIGRPLPVVDGLFLATARVHGLVFATRNMVDCGDRGVPIHNPWSP